MATYNWTYKNGINNKYGIVVPSTANDATRPTGFFYVAPWGNDTTGNGSRQLPYRTILKAANAVVSANTIILASGTYREYLSTVATTQWNIVGDGNVIIDVTLSGITFLSSSISFGSFYNIKFMGGQAVGANTIIKGFYDCVFVNMGISTATSALGGSLFAIQGCVFINATIRIGTIDFKLISNNTFYNCNVLFVNGFAEYSVLNLIFYQCNISFGQITTFIDWCLFYQCNFRFNTTVLTGTTYYPSVPTGYAYYSTMANVKSASVSAFGSGYKNFDNCIIADPLFNNLSIFDFTLDPSSPAKNLSYFGSYVGAFSIAKKLVVKSTDSLSSFDNSSATNLTIADNSLTLTSSSSPGSIETKPIENLLGRTYGRLPVLALNADRNGQFVNKTIDLSTSPISAGTSVPINTPYLVQVGSITYNGTVYNIGDRFTSAATSMSFTTSFGGVIAEILQAPSRQAIEARFNDGTTATIDNTGTIANGTWYYVVSGTATYNGDTYAAGDFFKGQSGVTSFTGTGVLRPTFTSSDTYFLFEIGQPITTNNSGNVITGAITKGNGASDFDRTPANIFSVNLKFIQLRYTINVANLTPQ